MPTPSPGRDLYRTEILSGRGMYGPMLGSDELARSRFFISTLEEFIVSSEQREVDNLSKGIESMSAEAKDEYWQWHYPIHWQDIFGVRIRSSFILQLCSHTEALLGDIAHRIQVIERCNIKLTELKGATLEQARKYYSQFGKFESPSADLWERMIFVFRIRNIHTHQQGFAGDRKGQERFFDFVGALPAVRIENSFMELQAGSCSKILEITEEFHAALLAEYEAYRLRSAAIERLTQRVA